MMQLCPKPSLLCSYVNSFAYFLVQIAFWGFSSEGFVFLWRGILEKLILVQHAAFRTLLLLAEQSVDKAWAIPSLVLENMAVVWWVWEWLGSGHHLRAAVFLSGPGPSLHGCHEKSCCPEAVIAELVGGSRQIMLLPHLLLTPEIPLQ